MKNDIVKEFLKILEDTINSIDYSKIEIEPLSIYGMLGNASTGKYGDIDDKLIVDCCALLTGLLNYVKPVQQKLDEIKRKINDD